VKLVTPKYHVGTSTRSLPPPYPRGRDLRVRVMFSRLLRGDSKVLIVHPSIVVAAIGLRDRRVVELLGLRAAG
jgi:hypothetical protein